MNLLWVEKTFPANNVLLFFGNCSIKDLVSYISLVEDT